MRIPVLAVVACAALSAGCNDPCKDLGDRLCDCRPTGQTRSSCTDTVSKDIERLHPGDTAKSRCSHYLDTCNSPQGFEFCDWLEGRCGKASCGMSQEDIETLQTTENPDDPNCADGAAQPELCTMICPGGASPPNGGASSSSGSSSSGGSSSSSGGSSSSGSSSSGAGNP